jgi:hypothetical protein
MDTEDHRDCDIGQYCPVCNAITCSGFLHQRVRFGRWKKRWFKLYEKGILQIFEDKTESSLVNEVDIKTNCYDVHHGMHNGKFPGGVPRVCAFVVCLNSKKLYLYSSNVADTLRWVTAIRKNSKVMSQRTEELQQMQRRLRVLRESGIEAAKAASSKKKDGEKYIADTHSEETPLHNSALPRSNYSTELAGEANIEDVADVTKTADNFSSFTPFVRDKLYSSNRMREEALKHLRGPQQTPKILTANQGQLIAEEDPKEQCESNNNPASTPAAHLSFMYDTGTQPAADDTSDQLVGGSPTALSDPHGLPPESLSTYTLPKKVTSAYTKRSSIKEEDSSDAESLEENKNQAKPEEQLKTGNDSVQQKPNKQKHRLRLVQASKHTNVQGLERQGACKYTSIDHNMEKEDQGNPHILKHVQHTPLSNPMHGIEEHNAHSDRDSGISRQPAVKHSRSKAVDDSNHKKTPYNAFTEQQSLQKIEEEEENMPKIERTKEEQVLHRERGQEGTEHNDTGAKILPRESPDGAFTPFRREIPSRALSEDMERTSPAFHRNDVHYRLQSLDDMRTTEFITTQTHVPEIRSASVFDLQYPGDAEIEHRVVTNDVKPILLRGEAKKHKRAEAKAVHFENVRGVDSPTPIRMPVAVHSKPSPHSGTYHHNPSPRHPQHIQIIAHLPTNGRLPTRQGVIQRPSNPPAQYRTPRKPSPEEQLHKLIRAIEFLGKPNSDGSFTVPLQTMKAQNIYKFYDLVAVVLTAKLQYLLTYSEHPQTGLIYLRTIPQDGTAV